MSSDFARVLAEAGEPPPGPRPAGWDAAAMLARMREDAAALRAGRAARHARNASHRQAGRELYEQTRQQAAPLLPWMGDEPPPFWLL